MAWHGMAWHGMAVLLKQRKTILVLCKCKWVQLFQNVYYQLTYCCTRKQPEKNPVTNLNFLPLKLIKYTYISIRSLHIISNTKMCFL
jgi:hypothetical protein